MKLIIPIAGRGTRLRPQTLSTPKPLVKVAGVPIIQRLVAEINRTCNVSEVVIIVSPDLATNDRVALKMMMQDMGLPLSICEQELPRGIAHALMCAKKHFEGPVMIAFGDMVIRNEYAFGFEYAWGGENRDIDAVVTVKRVSNPQNFGVVLVNQEGVVDAFVEKSQQFISDLAICGVYYFKDAERLMDAIENLILTQQRQKGEFQFTSVLQNLLAKGMKFHTAELREWHDCGNKDALLNANKACLNDSKSRIALSARVVNSVVLHPSFIGEDVVIENSVIEPFTTIENGARITNSHIGGSIVGEAAKVFNAQICDSIIGQNAIVRGHASFLNVSDYSEVEL